MADVLAPLADADAPPPAEPPPPARRRIRWRRPPRRRLAVVAGIATVAVIAGVAGMFLFGRGQNRSALRRADRIWAEAVAVDALRQQLCCVDGEIDSARVAAGVLAQEETRLGELANRARELDTDDRGVRDLRDQMVSALTIAGQRAGNEATRARTHEDVSRDTFLDAAVTARLDEQRRRLKVGPADPPDVAGQLSVQQARSTSMAAFLPSPDPADRVVVLGTEDGMRILDLGAGTVSVAPGQPGHIPLSGKTSAVAVAGGGKLIAASDSVGKRREYDFDQPVLALPLDTQLVPGFQAGTAWATVDGITREIGTDGDLTGPIVRLPAGAQLVGQLRAGLVIGQGDAVSIVALTNTGALPPERAVTGTLLAAVSDRIVTTGPDQRIVVTVVLPGGPVTPGQSFPPPYPDAHPISAALSADGRSMAVVWMRGECAAGGQTPVCSLEALLTVDDLTVTQRVIYESAIRAPGLIRPVFTPSGDWVLATSRSDTGTDVVAFHVRSSRFAYVSPTYVTIPVPGVAGTSLAAG